MIIQTRTVTNRHIPTVDHVTDGAMLVLWRLGMDTTDIAKKLNLHEYQVANELPRLRMANPK